MTKDEQYAFSCEKLVARVNTWDDIYLFFAETMGRVLESLNPHEAMNALFTMYAFITALKELPEEGDIKVLAKRMLHILIYESKEKLGAEIQVMTSAEMEEAQARAALAALIALRQRAGRSSDEDDGPHTLH